MNIQLAVLPLLIALLAGCKPAKHHADQVFGAGTAPLSYSGIAGAIGTQSGISLPILVVCGEPPKERKPLTLNSAELFEGGGGGGGESCTLVLTPGGRLVIKVEGSGGGGGR